MSNKNKVTVFVGVVGMVLIYQMVIKAIGKMV